MTTSTTLATTSLYTPATIARMIAGVTVCLAFVLGGMLAMGGALRDVVFVTSLMIVGGGCAAAAVMGFGLKLTEAAKLLRFHSMANAAIAMGMVGNVLGLIGVMKNLDHPDEIGPGIAVAFTAVVYSLGLWALLKAFQHARLVPMQEKSAKQVQAPETLESPLLALAATLLLLFATFVVLYAIQIGARPH